MFISLMSYNSHVTQSRDACQEKIKFEQQKNSIEPDKLIQRDLYEFFSRCSGGQRRVMNVLFMGQQWFSCMYMTQDYIARCAGVSRQYVNGVIRALCGAGILVKRYRHMTSCVYRVSNYFWRPAVRGVLSPLFKAFRTLSLALLTQYNIQGDIELLYNNTDPVVLRSWRLRECPTSMLSAAHFKTVGQSTRIKERLQKARESSMKKLGGTIQNLLTNCEITPQPIPQYIRDIDEISLTKWGQITLTAYPPDAIAAARTRFANATKPLSSPFRFFEWCALEYCNRHTISPQWKFRDELMLRFKAPACPKLYYNYPKHTHEAVKNQAEKKKWGVGVSYTQKSKIVENTPKFVRPKKYDPPPEKPVIDRAVEYEKMEAYRTSEEWQWLESFIGKAFNPFADE